MPGPCIVHFHTDHWITWLISTLWSIQSHEVITSLYFPLDYVAVPTVWSVYKLGLDTLMKKHIFTLTLYLRTFDSQSTEWLGLLLVFVVFSCEPTEWPESVQFRLCEGRLIKKSSLWFESHPSLVPCLPTHTPFLALSHTEMVGPLFNKILPCGMYSD